MYFLVFHGKENFRHKPFPGEHDHHDDEHAHDDHGHGHDAHVHVHVPHESPWVVTAPLVLLAIPSVVIGFMTIQAMLFGDFFKDSIFVELEKHPAMEELAKEFHGATAMAMHGLTALPFWLALAGVVTAYVFYMVKPSIPAAIARTFSPIVTILENKYYMDWVHEKLLSPAARALGTGLWKGGDQAVIDGFIINGSASAVGGFAGLTRQIQSGYLYWYALVMIMGVIGLMTWQLWPFLSPWLGL
jgi:NADH-quinone oxidoreductase subunit L